MYKNIMDVVPGDTILDGGNRTEVREVDTERCMGKVHINNKDCYEGFAEVRVQDAK